MVPARQKAVHKLDEHRPPKPPDFQRSEFRLVSLGRAEHSLRHYMQGLRLCRFGFRYIGPQFRSKEQPELSSCQPVLSSSLGEDRHWWTFFWFLAVLAPWQSIP